MSLVGKLTLSCVLSAAVCLALSAIWVEPAAARRKPTPVINRGSDVVGYGDRARIVGHLEGGRKGQVVALKRRIVGKGRTIARKKAVDENRRVVFRLKNRRRSAVFRLVFRPKKGRKRVSNPHRIDVRPRLRFNVEPNDVKARKAVELRGTFAPAMPDRVVKLKLRVKGEWTVVKRVDVSDGVYFRTFVPEVKGHRKMRAAFASDDWNAETRRHERLWIYKRGPATWYGPGFWGNKTACGQTLRKKTLGVAHRKLPCGTRVNFLYKGRTITVRVIDRGPFGEADWDLTQRTARKLRFEGRDEVGYWVNR